MGESDYVRERLASAFRDWVHASPLSQCGRWADTCPDWPLAYELADLALSTLVLGEAEAVKGEGPGAL